MPLLSRYLRGSQQISRFPKLQGKGQRSAAFAALPSRPLPEDLHPRWCSQTPALSCRSPPIRAGTMPPPAWMFDVTAWQGHADDYVEAPVWPTLPVETVEFPVSYASDKSMPLARREPEDRPFGVPAVTNADLATGQARHLDAVAVGVTQ
jgi:hypothetical protein